MRIKKRLVHEFPHLVFLGVSVAALWFAPRIGFAKESVEIWGTLIALVANFLFVWFRFFIRRRGELTPVRSFIIGNLFPSKSPKEVKFRTEVAVMGDQKEAEDFCENLEANFKKPLNHEDKRWLTFLPLSWRESSSLEAHLSDTGALVVLENDGLGEEILGHVDGWAQERSEIPVLITLTEHKSSDRPLSRLQKLWRYRPRLVPLSERFRRIRKDPTTLPWKLLQRANERSMAWSEQASFNRFIALQGLAFVIVGIVMAQHTLVEERREANNVTSEMYNVMESRSAYDALSGMSTNVSYFFRQKDSLNVYVTTEKDPQQDAFADSKASIIGCAFSEPNQFAFWDKETGTVSAWTFDGATRDASSCTMGPRASAPISSIVCASYNPDKTEKSLTVGICAFTAKGKLPVTPASEDLLKLKLREFYNRANGRIRSERLVPLIVRRSWSLPEQ